LVWPHSECRCHSEMRKYVLLGKCQVERIIDFRPRQTGGCGESYLHTLVGQFLYSSIEELVNTARHNQVVNLAKELLLDGVVKHRDADVGRAKFFFRYFLAHSDHASIRDDHLHGLIPPGMVYDHRYGRIRPQRRIKNVGFQDYIGAKADKTVATQPVARQPYRIEHAGCP